MRKYLLLIAILGLLMSCDKEEIPTYSGIDNVFVDFPEVKNYVYRDSVFVNMKRTDIVGYANDSIIRIPLRTMGNISGVDRKVNAKLDYNLSAEYNKQHKATLLTATEDDVEIVGGVIPANLTKGYLEVKLKNSDRLKAKGDTIALAIELVDSDSFSVEYSAFKSDTTAFNSTRFRIFFRAVLGGAPRLWEETAKFATATDPRYPGTDGSLPFKYDLEQYLATFLGEYSEEKMKIFLAACDLTLDMFEFTDEEAIEMGITSTGITRAKAVFNKRFNVTSQTTGRLFDRWKILVRYYMSITEPYNLKEHPDYEKKYKILWGHSGKIWYANVMERPLAGWGYLN